MDFQLYRAYMKQYIRDAIANSDGTNVGIARALDEVKIGRWFVQHKEEKVRALDDARKGFTEHRHWPREMVLSQLGIDLD
jgi:hypothetical protein